MADTKLDIMPRYNLFYFSSLRVASGYRDCVVSLLVGANV